MPSQQRKVWTDIEEELLRRFYPDVPTKILAEHFSRPINQVYSKAALLGLKKSDTYLDSPHACRLRRGDNVGKNTRFAAGHIPHNAGVKGWQAGGRSRKTQFKKGSRPANWKPIGSERVSRDGYLQRKMTDTGYPPKDWRCVHHLLWEQTNGPIPQGHAVVFKNGNKRDIHIENLELISRVELMRRNTVHRYPKELANLIQLKGALQRQINRKQREANERQD